MGDPCSPNANSIILIIVIIILSLAIIVVRPSYLQIGQTAYKLSVDLGELSISSVLIRLRALL